MTLLEKTCTDYPPSIPASDAQMFDEFTSTASAAGWKVSPYCVAGSADQLVSLTAFRIDPVSNEPTEEITVGNSSVKQWATGTHRGFGDNEFMSPLQACARIRRLANAEDRAV